MNECTYHINYQLVTGVAAADRQKLLVDADANKYSYMRSSSGKATGRRGRDGADFQEVCQVFKSIGVGADLQSALFQTMSGLVHLGNITLAEGSNSETVVTSTTELKNSSKLLCTHEALLQQGLTSRTMKLKGSEMQAPKLARVSPRVVGFGGVGEEGFGVRRWEGVGGWGEVGGCVGRGGVTSRGRGALAALKRGDVRRADSAQA